MTGEGGEQLELGGGDLEQRVRDANLVAIAIDLDGTDREHRARFGDLAGGATQHGSDARHQLARRERLGEVIVGAEIQAEDAIGFHAARRQHHDRDAAR